jgi:hypothetical protein
MIKANIEKRIDNRNSEKKNLYFWKEALGLEQLTRLGKIMKSELKNKNFLKAINEFLTPEQQPRCVQVVEWAGLVVFRSLGVFQNFQGDVFYHAFYLGFVLQHMRRSEMSFKVR